MSNISKHPLINIIFTELLVDMYATEYGEEVFYHRLQRELFKVSRQ
jgi:hypothetical protein